MTIETRFTYTFLRQAFLDFFATKNHEIVASSSLVPNNDPTLLFTNAGMVQFKDIFLGIELRSYKRAVSAQRCVRAGGKHNDLENVGYTARHHTFFEMLGNFSFGDYFKREAIHFAWEFLTQVLKLPAEKLWITVFEDDNEAADIWLKEIKIDAQRFSRCGEKDNFWSMGDIGPCGPCSEIFYDHGSHIAGGPPGSPDADGDRYVEIWNLVFMQYERNQQDELKILPKPSVDTGMGLERLAAVMQGVNSNYDTDLFKYLIEAMAAIANTKDLTIISLRVCADHIRSASFLILDGIIPSNEGRGYVLRRIIRRAVRHGNKLGLTNTFFYRLVKPLVNQMGKTYPELIQAQAHIERILSQEEKQFAKTLELGLKILEQDLIKLTGTIIPGSTVFRLYDTYGFPVDLTADIARERGLTLDYPSFEEEMAKQRSQSRDAGKFDLNPHEKIITQTSSCFTGYEVMENNAFITELFLDGQPVQALSAGDNGVVILDHTPFYAESGGQVGDQGILSVGNANFFEVADTKKIANSFLHYGLVKSGTLRINDSVIAQINIEKRNATARNHTATHLLHAALRAILGVHVTQKGSLVQPERLRFDFSHSLPITKLEIAEIDKLINQKIRANHPVTTQLMSPEDASARGALALFGEKYGTEVRVLQLADFSIELCGGTHVKATGEIGFFKIVTETGIAAGVRRIEALTGTYAEAWLASVTEQMNEAADLLKTTMALIPEKLIQLIDKNRALEKQLFELQAKSAAAMGLELISNCREIKGIKVLAEQLPSIDIKLLRDIVDQIKQTLGKSIVILGSVMDEKVNIVVGVSKDTVNYISAGVLANYIAQQIGGKGGGRPDMAQAGGNNPAALAKALQNCYVWIEEQLSLSQKKIMQ